MITLTYSYIVCELPTQTNAYYHCKDDTIVAIRAESEFEMTEEPASSATENDTAEVTVEATPAKERISKEESVEFLKEM